MKALGNPLWLLLLVTVLLPLFVLHPEFDLIASRPFYDTVIGGKDGFWLRQNGWTVFLHEGCLIVARATGVCLLALAFYFWRTGRHWGGPGKWLNARSALFLVLALIIGPGLVTNSIAKDHWGRARPFQVEEFGGQLEYTPALFMADECPSNCSFFSGDGALGFTLHAPFYVVPRRWRRPTFWLGWLGGGVLLGGNRLIMGAHFLSDVLFAGMAMLLVIAGLYAAMYGGRALRQRWGELLQGDDYMPAAQAKSAA